VLKNAGLGVCVALGRMLPIQGLSVLCYHSIDESGSYMSTRPEMFRVQMEWLRDHGIRAISVRQFFEGGAPRIAPERTVVLTFDDGLANFADAAWPVLRELSFSATAYVPTAFIGGEPTWYADFGLPRMPCMGWDAIRAMQRAGADIQSHAVTHRDLTTLPPDELRDELRRSKAALEDGLGDSVDHLAYPFGAVAPAVGRAAREAGYRSAVVLGKGRWHPATDPYGIPRDCLNRIDIRSARTARLSIEACVRGTFGWYAETKARVRSLYAVPPHLRGRPRLD
jgi:peptidoglycan/xylan/chitin deacetylase (PgdA/CDA1 family)